jgi:hypothetical protein
LRRQRGDTPLFMPPEDGRQLLFFDPMGGLEGHRAIMDR